MLKRGSRNTHSSEPGRAVEVTAIFGESIIAMQHLTPARPDAGRRSKITRVSLIVGALLLLGSAIAFREGVQVAAQNEQSYLAHVQEKRLAHEFRPKNLHAGWEWLGLGGALSGLLLIIVGVSRRRKSEDEAVFRIGTSAGCDYPASLTSDSAFKLVSASAVDGFVLTLPEDWSAEIGHGGQALRLQGSHSGFRRARLPQDFEAHLRSGDHRFVIRSVDAPRKQSLPLLAALDSRFLAHLGGTTLLVLGMMFLFDTHFQEESTLYRDLFDSAPREGLYRVSAYEKERLRPAFAMGNVAGPVGGTGESMAGVEAAMGTPQTTRGMGRYAMQKQEAPPQLARALAMAEAREAGILGVLRRNPSFASSSATDAFSSGLDDADVYGGFIGNEVGEMTGAWGYGVRGLGKAGGGSGFGTIGTGNYGVLGHGSGNGSGWGAGSGLGARGLDAAAPGVRIGNATRVGDLDKNIIRRYIRRKLPRIQHCYERELVASPSFEGSVETAFQITPKGTVLAASVSGIDNEEMHRCIASVLRSIHFPEPHDGGYVSVNYPFTFSQTP